MSVEQKLITAEELWEMPEVPGKRFELVDGELVEMPGAGTPHMLLMTVIYKLIDAYVLEHDLGQVFPDGESYILRRSPDRVRIPDVSFVSHARVPDDGMPEGYWPGAPNLAVEIVSSNDNASDLHDKDQDYLDAGTQIVWVVWPRRQSVTVHTPGGTAPELGPEDELDGGDLLPGFRVRVAALFEVS